MISDTTVHHFIRSWQQACFGDQQVWPSISPIARIVEYLTRIDPSPISPPEITDGEVMAQIVTAMSYDHLDLYLCFIARYLAVIEGQRQPKMRYVDRASALGVTRDQFNSRCQKGFEYCHKELDKRLH